MAEVFRAKLQSDRTERLFAIKKILPSLCEDANFIKMFVEEARLAGQLQHPNICAIHELGRADGAHFLAMEYIWGKDLIQVRTKLRKAKQKVPLEICVFILARVLDGLDYAHKKRDPLGRMLGLVHRDLSPHNVLISYDGDVKVIDFGIAKADSRASMTQVGTLKGKFAYMSPEQVQGGKLDRRSDVFALGTLFYELVTGERLFFGESDFNTLERVRKVEVRPPRDIDPMIPPEVEAIIYKALAKEVENRYQWCAEMRADLEPFLAIDAAVVGAWMHQIFAAEIPIEREQIEFGLAQGRKPNTPIGGDGPANVTIPAPASLAARRAQAQPVIEDQRSRSGGAGSRPGQPHVHVEDHRSKPGGIRAASAVHVEDNRSRPGVFRPPVQPVAPSVEREQSRPRVIAPIDTVATPMLELPSSPVPPESKAVTTPMPTAARVAPHRTKAPSFTDEFKDEPPTQSSVPSFGGSDDWIESQQPMWGNDAVDLGALPDLEVAELPARPAPSKPKWPEPPVSTETVREGLPKWTEKVATEQSWADQETALSSATEPADAWNDVGHAPEEPIIESLEVPADPTLDLLDLDLGAPETMPGTGAPQTQDDDFLDLYIDAAPPDDDPEPPPAPAPEPAPEPAAPDPTNRVLRFGGGRFRPNRNR